MPRESIHILSPWAQLTTSDLQLSRVLGIYLSLGSYPTDDSGPDKDNRHCSKNIDDDFHLFLLGLVD